MSKISVGESFTVALISGSEKVYGQEGGRAYQVFPSKNLLSHTAENLRRESFTVGLISGTEKIGEKGGISRFSVKNIFLSHSVENFRRGILYCCINFGSEKVDGQEGGRTYHVFPSKNVYLTLPKISIGTPLLLD